MLCACAQAMKARLVNSGPLLELGVLGFELALGFRHLHAAELGASLVESSIAEAAVAAQLLDRHTRFGLPQDPM